MCSRKHVPYRTCLVCGFKGGKGDLVRIVAEDEGITIDVTGRLRGRGAYLCRQVGCRKDRLRIGRLSHALRRQISESDWERFAATLRRHELGTPPIDSLVLE